jgi:hypothetical protein
MAKKGLFILVVATLVTGGVFAQTPFTFSAGFGGFIGGDFGGGLGGDFGGNIEINYTALGSTKTTIDIPYFGGGGYAFLDAKYAELTLGIYRGSGKLRMKQEAKDDSSFFIQQESDISIINFNIGLSLKYPFEINKISIYPLWGIGYHIALSVKDDGNEYTNLDGKESPGDFSALWFNFGGGADYLFTEKIYLRFEALYGIRLPTRYENDLEKYYREVVFYELAATATAAGVPGYLTVTPHLRPGHGLMARLAIGFKLY